jgi:hypothetical protein
MPEIGVLMYLALVFIGLALGGQLSVGRADCYRGRDPAPVANEPRGRREGTQAGR